MWIIESKVLGSKYHLLPEQSYVVGRKDCDVLILGDPAISRRHATFSTSTQVQSPNVPIPRSTLHLEDQSKFGTYVNKDKMKNGQKIQLKEGDIITFGTDKSSFKLSHEDLVVTTSCLDTNMKKSVKSLIKKIGGCLVSEWNKYCDLAIMSNLSVTIKVICALIMNKPVVTPEYLVQLHKSLENHASERPDPKLFLPSLNESQLDPEEVSFTENPGRRQLFQGMKFIFLTSKQHQKLHVAVELAGGATVLMENGDGADEASVIGERSLVLFSDLGESQISQLSQTTQQWVNKVLNLLKENDKRAIPEAELGYAVLYCSTQKYCNPDVIPQVDHFPTVAASAPDLSVSQSAPNTANQQSTRGSKVWGGPSGETGRSTLLETDSRSPNSVKDFNSKKRVRETSETSPSLPAPKLPKQTASPDIATTRGAIKRTTSPVPMTTVEESAVATEATVKQEAMSQSLDLFPTNPNTTRTSRAGSGEIFGESDFTAVERSTVDDIFASPVIQPIKGPMQGDDEFDTVPGTSRRRRQDTKLNTTRLDTQSNRETSSTQARRQRADSGDVDEFDVVTSSRKRRRQTQTQLTQVKMKVIEPELLLLDTDPPTQAPQVAEKKPAVAKIDEGEFIRAKHAPENTKVKRETDHAHESETASEKEEAKNCCNVKTTNLLRRQPKSTVQEGEYNMWKGKRVKNFKKFRKAGTHQSQGDEDIIRLPRIIGGRDLLPHKTLKQKSIMQKFAKELEEQSSQQDNFDQDVTAMFDAVPSNKTVARKARR